MNRRFESQSLEPIAQDQDCSKTTPNRLNLQSNVKPLFAPFFTFKALALQPFTVSSKFNIQLYVHGCFCQSFAFEDLYCGRLTTRQNSCCSHLANTSSTFFQGLKDKLSLLVNG